MYLIIYVICVVRCVTCASCVTCHEKLHVHFRFARAHLMTSISQLHYTFEIYCLLIQRSPELRMYCTTDTCSTTVIVLSTALAKLGNYANYEDMQ
jgi:hypothetical protein